MKASLIPKSKAENAHALLGEICALVLEEPRRLRMGIVLVQGCTEREIGLPVDQIPACGTVGCVAGWTLVLKGDPDSERGSRLDAAAKVLGLNEFQQDDLFLTFPMASDGTVDHAKEEVALIRKFQKKHRAQLLAKKV